MGRIIVELKDIEERKVDADQVIARLRRKLAVVPGATVFLQSYQDIRVGGLFTSSQYQYTLQGETLEELQNWAPRIEARIRTLPGLRDVASDQQDRGLQASLVIRPRYRVAPRHPVATDRRHACTTRSGSARSPRSTRN